LKRSLEPFAPSGRRSIASRLPGAISSTAVIDTSAGRVRGRRLPDMVAFTGVPYAAPPTKGRRFRPPEPHAGWPGVLDATRTPPEAPQQSTVPRFPAGVRRTGWSEDCLFLNVFTPATDAGRRPVMVWIHGGAFVNGSGSRVPFDPTHMVLDDDVVVVSINYRLGPLGWMYLGHIDPDYAGSGNNGLLDQVAALRWVADNIAAFGGDPGNVTVVGTSAGAMSIVSLLASPAVTGLFHRAIAQSGAGAYPITIEHAATYADRLMSSTRARTIGELIDLPVERFTAHLPKVTSDLSAELEALHRLDMYLLLGPVIDGITLLEPPHDTIRRGAAADLPLIVGTNAREYAAFLHLFAPEDKQLHGDVQRWFGDRGPDVLRTYGDDVGDADDDRYEMLLTDRCFRIPARRLAEAHVEGCTAPCYEYLFRWNPPERLFGAAHGSEIPVVFDVRDRRELNAFGFRRHSTIPVELAHAMRGAWTALARSGDPNHAELPQWRPVTDGHPTMVFDNVSQLAEDLDAKRLALWEGVV
jgi:para-nitrobenzyl esterase